MTTYVLVHGGWRGGWVYQPLATMLRARGHVVYTPSLSGSAEHSHRLNGDITLSTHVEDLVNLIKWEQLDDIVLVGHSYGGMVITGAADRERRHVRGLVYLDAVVPSPGKSMVEDYPAWRTAFVEAASGNRGLYMDPLPASFFGVRPENQKLVDELSTPFPLATAIEKLAFSPETLENLPKTFVLAEGWDANPYVINKGLAEDPAWSFHTVPVGHDLMLDAPDLVADVLTGPGARTTLLPAPS
ncbi:alpha/beta fold hydrolase [Amycolatopsis endophytica]|uniref:Pimeloyl-ACP methyl ester carboxylesterase n=1 Tax=Amycolatopsis endophytica TaxID=860233 RepID=A0A853B436_9PSEU|nr:alpha/beta hydrolase [Amycolatopsis endophytica]NYI89898.1 pimeloyl-ACP methyl ester carboxylesterase [Amycolatopsis endophytica]